MNLSLILGKDEEHLIPQIKAIISQQGLPPIDIQVEGKNDQDSGDNDESDNNN